MDIRTLEDLLALIEAGSISRAAALRNLTQPAFSRRIAAVEAEIGAPLVGRQSRPAAPLPVLVENRAEIERLAGALRGLRADLGQREPLVHICTMHSIGATLLPRAIADLENSTGSARVRLRSRNREDCYAMLMTDRASIMVVYENSEAELAFDQASVDKVLLCEDRLVPLIAPAALDRLLERMRKRNTLPLIGYPEDAFFGAVMRAKIYPRLGQQPITKAVSTFVPAILECAASGLGVGWVPARLAERHVAAGSLVDLQDHLPSCPLSIVMLRKTKPVRCTAETEWRGLLRFFSGLPASQ